MFRLRALVCWIGRHDWAFVLIPYRGHLWIAKRCRHCHWQTIAHPLGELGRRSC